MPLSQAELPSDFDSTAKKVPEPTVLFGLGVVVAGLTVSRRQKIS
ncbi:MAG: PEP-CTERM sorting domain-containing protein [Okeania sp. SIO3B3]|nr:PEP-CTERM sorting domain-containing protein [Okeania sp. SIO3B3]